MSLICDIFDVMLIDDTGEIFASTTLQSADINIKVNSTDINAGRNNSLIAILHSGRQADIALAETSFKWDFLAKQLGQTVVTGVVEAWAFPKWYTAVDTTGIISITLDNPPISIDSGIKMYSVDGVAVTGTVVGAVVTFLTGVTGGALVEVRGYKYTSGATSSSIVIDNVSFPDGVKCILETLEIDEDESLLARIQYIFDEVLLSGNITVATKKEKDAVISNVELRAIKPRTSDVIGKVIRIPFA
ncbi:MAG TPA: hypothetical protein VFD03_10185 [Clostridia bacterium]|nr:hypothetical protein [Clostridia bacterium]